MPAPWPETSLDGEPRFVVGHRKGSGLINCYRIDIHEDTFGDFRNIAQGALSRIYDLARRPYEYFGALEEDEYFALDFRNIPRRPVRTSRQTSARSKRVHTGTDVASSQKFPAPGDQEAASAIQMVAQTDEHSFMTNDRLRSGLKLNFYMVSFPIESGFLGFIRQTKPYLSLTPGIRYFQYGDTLKRVKRPDFVLDNRVDMIIGPDEVAIFSNNVVQVLFRDVRLVMDSVNNNVQMIGAVFADHLPLTPGGISALGHFGNRGPRNAKRIHDLANYRLDDLKLDVPTIAVDLSNHQLDHILVNGELVLSDESISSFLDYLEGRLFHDDHTHEPRRADRFSRRSPK